MPAPTGLPLSRRTFAGLLLAGWRYGRAPRRCPQPAAGWTSRSSATSAARRGRTSRLCCARPRNPSGSIARIRAGRCPASMSTSTRTGPSRAERAPARRTHRHRPGHPGHLLGPIRLPVRARVWPRPGRPQQRLAAARHSLAAPAPLAGGGAVRDGVAVRAAGHERDLAHAAAVSELAVIRLRAGRLCRGAAGGDHARAAGRVRVRRLVQGRGGVAAGRPGTAREEQPHRAAPAAALRGRARGLGVPHQLESHPRVGPTRRCPIVSRIG
jgi:hypothetical protein